MIHINLRDAATVAGIMLGAYALYIVICCVFLKLMGWC